jgi:hypothetical protein
MLDIILDRIKLKIADFGMQIKSSQQAAAPLATALGRKRTCFGCINMLTC